MSPPSKTSLTVAEKLDLFLTILKTASVALSTIFTAPFRGSQGHRTFWKHVVHKAVRTMNTRASARQLQAITPSTDDAYNQFMKTKKVNPATKPLKNGGKALWIGRQSADNILVFFPGGGFVYPAATQFDFLWEVQKATGDNSAAVLLSFSLAPGSQYPTQLEQAIGLLTYLIEETGKKPENIVITGDSAGGNLALAVLSHMLHPHPSIKPLLPPGPFKGVLLISPWVSFATSSSSYSQNGQRDVTNGPVLKKWSEYYMGNARPDEYNQPLLAADSWWNGLNAKVREMFVMAGTDETMFSDQEKFTRVLKRAIPDLEVIFAAGETHDQPFMDPLTGEKSPSETKRAAVSWLSSKL